MENIKFSWCWSQYSVRGYDKDGHKKQQLKIVPITDMKPFIKGEWEIGYKNQVQMSSYDYRVIKDTPYKYWNGCIFIDIDYKKWIHDYPDDVISPEYILRKVFTYMEEHYPLNLYYGELSRSNKGFHFIFYYDCDRTRQMFDYYNRYTRRIVEVSFEKCGFSEIIHHKGVLDECTKSFSQCCYLTRNQELFNEFCTGDLVNYPGIQIECSEEEDYQLKQYKSNNRWNFSLKHRDDSITQVEYIDHFQRWNLFNSLSVIFKDGLELKREWERCSRMIPEENGHDYEYYSEIPYRGDWYRKLTGNEFVNTSLLEDFGYTINVTPKPTILVEELLTLLDKLN